ncbi:peptidoglycan recognition protein [Streptomyces sp. NPDC051567]|uniref:peptidoglycan recognition protein n=1 Tax=Streptomyces sp. NPDC051567 TaxID=3365660 RepID=UPI0037A1E2DB
MRGLLASSIVVATAAALALPVALPTPALAESVPVTPAGSTQSLPLVPLGRAADRSGVPSTDTSPHLPEARGLAAHDVRTFSLVGVVWDDASTQLSGHVQVRTRSTATAAWSGWQDVETHNSEHAADPGTAERGSGRVRGATAPLWVGESDGVEVRVQAEPDAPAGRVAARLPSGMRIELVDPGEAEPVAVLDGKTGRPEDDDKGASGATRPGLSMAAAEASSANAPHAPLGATELSALDKADSTADALFASEGALVPAARPYIGPRPRIVTRKGWGANESLREKGFVYTGTVKAAFVHHTASGNNYACADAPAVLRSLYRYHVVSSGWRDIGYNFAVDKCGTVYEGRAGGVAKPVLGAHTMGFNSDSMGIAVIGSYGSTAPPRAAVDAVSRLTAWKLGLFGADPRGRTTLKSAGGNLYGKGRNARLNVISGHRDGFATECPGRLLYGKLPATRTASARLQGRP